MPNHYAIIAGLALFASALSGGRELAFRHGAEPCMATVRTWDSHKHWGFTGSARVDVDSVPADATSKNRPVPTVLWYRPTAGERVAVLRKPNGALHMGSWWQGFGIAILCLLSSAAAALMSWLTREATRNVANEE